MADACYTCLFLWLHDVHALSPALTPLITSKHVSGTYHPHGGDAGAAAVHS
jgi:hypothetical protein